MERLQRVLAAAGIASRRRAEELIVDGRVRVDGEIVTELGTRVDPATQKIEVDGKLIPHVRRRYILLNKPSGYITTTSDERSRYTVMDLVPVDERVVPVGRLDRQTEGLLLLTNDGEVANRVMHPRYGIDKEYEALLDGYPPPAVLERLRRGITIDGQRATPEMVRPIRNTEDGTIVRIVIHEGRNRIVRKMFDEVGYPVLKLIRTRVGPLQLGAIPRGTFRDLTDGELNALREALHLTDEDVAYAERIAGRPLRDRPDPNRMKSGRPRTPQGSRESRGQGGPSRPRRDVDRRPGGPRGRRDDDHVRPARPTRDGQYAGPPQARRRDERAAPTRATRDNQDRRSRREGPPNRRDDDQRRTRSGAPPGQPAHGTRRDAERRPSRTRSDSDEGRRDRSSRPPQRAGRPGTGPPRRGPSGPNRGSSPGKSRQGQKNRGQRGNQERGAGAGGERPPDDNRDRRSGGGGEEHGRRDRRPED